MPRITCIYCGLEKESSEEHVVQKALGGVTTIPKVCGDCNRIFGSGIDDALTVKSPLAILIRQELGGASPKTWDIDESRDGLLLDGMPTPGESSMVRLPQLVFDGDEQITYFDGEDIESNGFDLLHRTFNRRLRAAFHHYRLYGPNARKRDHRKKDMLKLQQNLEVRPKYRYPPRVCCLGELMSPKEVVFSLRYQQPIDCQKALDALSAMNFDAPFVRKAMQLGSENPEIHINFCPNDIGRAIAKIGFNLLSLLAVATNPSRAKFPRSVEWILEDKHANEFFDLRRHGFVEPDGLAGLCCHRTPTSFASSTIHRETSGRSMPPSSAGRPRHTLLFTARIMRNGEGSTSSLR